MRFQILLTATTTTSVPTWVEANGRSLTSSAVRDWLSIRNCLSVIGRNTFPVASRKIRKLNVFSSTKINRLKINPFPFLSNISFNLFSNKYLYSRRSLVSTLDSFRVFYCLTYPSIFVQTLTHLILSTNFTILQIILAFKSLCLSLHCLHPICLRSKKSLS